MAASTRILLACGAGVAAAATFPLDVRVKFVRFPRPLIHVVAESLGLRRLLVCLLAQPSCLNLRLLSVRTRTGGLGLALAGIKFAVLGVAADLGSLFAVRVIPLLLYRLPAPSCREQQQHNKHHRNNGNYHPNPWSCFHVTHHFPLRCDPAGRRLSGRLIWNRL